jgi:hypothetical protein
MPRLISDATKLATLRRQYKNLECQNAAGCKATRVLVLLAKDIGLAASAIPEDHVTRHLLTSWANIAREGLR